MTRVLGAGEVGFERRGEGWAVALVGNQSTGYCPDLESWDAVARALDTIGLSRPAGFTQAVVFRRCEVCKELNVVREGFFACAFCESDLPIKWNIGERIRPGWFVPSRENRASGGAVR